MAKSFKKSLSELDFTPSMYLENHDGEMSIHKVISDDECAFLGGPWALPVEQLRKLPEYGYFVKLHTYYDRFGVHMPVPIRKEFLRELRPDA